MSSGDRALEAALPRQTRTLESLGSTPLSWFETPAGDSDGWPTAIYVHGTPGSAGAFASYIIDPVPGVRSVSLDRPGFGESSPGRSWPALTDQAAALDPLVRAASLGSGSGKPILIGHSLGGPIVCRYAAEHPDAVGGLVLLGAALDPALEKTHPLQYIGRVPPISWLLPSMLRHANEELMPLEGELEELSSILGRITCPVIIVHGTDDGLVPYENVAYMERAFVGSASVEVVTLPGEGHFLPWEHEALVRAVVRSMSAEAELREP